MKTLTFHSRAFHYILEHSSQVADQVTSKDVTFINALVVFICVEPKDTKEMLLNVSYDIIKLAERSKPDNIVLNPFPQLSDTHANANIARSLIRELHEILNFTWAGAVAACPFGWYKSFTLNSQGHKFAQVFKSY